MHIKTPTDIEKKKEIENRLITIASRPGSTNTKRNLLTTLSPEWELEKSGKVWRLISYILVFGLCLFQRLVSHLLCLQRSQSEFITWPSSGSESNVKCYSSQYFFFFTLQLVFCLLVNCRRSPEESLQHCNLSGLKGLPKRSAVAEMIFHVQGRWIICDLSVARIPGKQIHINNEAEVFVFSQTFTCVHQGEGDKGGCCLTLLPKPVA